MEGYGSFTRDVKIWEEPLVIPTYQISDPDPNPIFYTGRAYQGAQGHVYPYPMLDKLTDNRIEKVYKAAFLENEYIKVCVLPEIGGRIFFATDKTNNYDFFYHQHVIKPALIGMLGAWISGGVEWNIPHHHRATTFMPVDYTLRENPDGSKTIWVGEIELRHRMKWIVGITLYPGKSYIEVTIKLFNRTPLAHSFLIWANPAVHANENYQIIFPPRTEYATFHGKNQFSHWPISYEVFAGVDYTSGVDVSWWKNHLAPTSFFAWNYKDDFLAGYDHGKRAGTVAVANHHIVPGKKFFLWGNGSEGRMWEKILTDADGPYIELMIGAYSDNQPDYTWIQPYEVKTCKIYWYPIREIGGVKNANREAAINLEIDSENTVSIGVYTTSERKSSRVILKASGKVVFEREADISPTKPFVERVQLPLGAKEEDLELILLSSQGEEIISYKPVRKENAPMPKPVEPPKPPKEIETIEELYLTGLRLEQFYNPAIEPYPYYEEALRRDPYDYRTNIALAILYCKRGMFKEAEEHLRRALERATKNYVTPKDGEAYYYLGVALRAQEKYEEAYDAFYKATWYHAWHAAAYYSLAEIDCQRGDFLKALEHLDLSLSTNTLNTRALNLKATVLRKMRRLKEAEEIALKALAIDPLDFWAENELYLVKSKMGLKEEADKELENLRMKMRDNVQSYLELAVDYGNCGFLEEAIDVLSRAIELNKRGLSDFPMVYYYLGYFWDMKGERDKAMEYYRLGGKMPADYCFPFRVESLKVLKRVLEVNDHDAKAHFYLGNLLYYFNRYEEAIKEWEKSRDLDDTFSITHRNLGLAYARVRNDIHRAIASLEKAIECNSKDPRLYYELDRLYEIGGVPVEKRLSLLEKNHEAVVKRDDALSREIILYVQTGQYDKAIDLLRTHHFHVWEGGGEIHDVYVDAHLLRGLKKLESDRYEEALKDFEAALEYPENLEVGRPYRGVRLRDPQVYYYMGTAYEALGKENDAKICYERAISAKVELSELSYYQGLSLMKLGRREEADKIFDDLISFARERIEKGVGMDFFEKFGEKEFMQAQMAYYHYLLGLGYMGKGELQEAKDNFRAALKLNPYHVWAKVYLSELSKEMKNPQ
ncbi:MAG: DUF5107 domain-containing protein [Candidatus Bathyarchaeia archaeon]